MTIAGVRVRIHPLLWPMALAAIWLGEGQRLTATTLALCSHECAHILAAQLAGCHGLELELLPFGGAARLPDVWLLRPWQRITVALAGPCVNLLTLLFLSAAFWWGVCSGPFPVLLLKSSAMLLAFNLLPALPLDGGCALLALTGKEDILRALSLCCASGLLFAAAAGQRLLCLPALFLLWKNFRP